MEGDHMEPFDFDKLIKEKVQEAGNIHSRESNQARSGIWMEIQDKVKKNTLYISWYHLAASIVFLIAGFSIILFKVQKHYLNETQVLQGKIEMLERDFSESVSSSIEKDQKIQLLTSNLSNLENTVTELSGQQEPQPLTKVIYKTDTVYLKSVEYVTYTPDNNIDDELNGKVVDAGLPVDTDDTDQTTSSVKTDNIIYPSPKSKSQAEESEKVKIRFGNYIAREN